MSAERPPLIDTHGLHEPHARELQHRQLAELPCPRPDVRRVQYMPRPGNQRQRGDRRRYQPVAPRVCFGAKIAVHSASPAAK